MMAEPSIIVDQQSAGLEDDIGPATLGFPFHYFNVLTERGPANQNDAERWWP